MDDKTDDLFSTISIIRTASDEELRICSNKIRGGLPKSYIKFAKNFGTGITNDFFVILMPFSIHGNSTLLDRGASLKKQSQNLIQSYIEDGAALGDFDCLEPLDDESKSAVDSFDDLVFYGSSINGHYLSWLHKSGCEKFFIIDRACFTIRCVGENLISFIRATQTEKVRSILGEGYGPLPKSFVGTSIDSIQSG